MDDRVRKGLADLAELTPEAVKAVREALADDDKGLRLRAAALLFDRTAGKPPQAIELTDERQVDPLAEMSPREKLAHLEDVQAGIAAEMEKVRAELAATGTPIDPEAYRAKLLDARERIDGELAAVAAEASAGARN